MTIKPMMVVQVGGWSVCRCFFFRFSKNANEFCVHAHGRQKGILSTKCMGMGLYVRGDDLIAQSQNFKNYKECKDLLKFFQITYVLVSRKVGFNREGNGKVAAAKYEGKIHWDKIYLKRTPHESFGISFTKFCVVCMCSMCMFAIERL